MWNVPLSNLKKSKYLFFFWIWLSDNWMDNSSIHSDKVRLGLTGCFQQTLPKLSNSISRPRSCCLRILAWMLFLSKLRGWLLKANLFLPRFATSITMSCLIMSQKRRSRSTAMPTRRRSLRLLTTALSSRSSSSTCSSSPTTSWCGSASGRRYWSSAKIKHDAAALKILFVKKRMLVTDYLSVHCEIWILINTAKWRVFQH